MFRVVQNELDHDIFQSDLDKLVQWSRVRQMKFNLEKCKVLQTGRVVSKHTFKMEGSELQEIEKEKPRIWVSTLTVNFQHQHR